MNTIIQKLLYFLTEMVSGKNKHQKEIMDDFCSFVRNQMDYLMEQIRTFQDNYIQVSNRLNDLYREIRALNDELTAALRNSCLNAEKCPERE